MFGTKGPDRETVSTAEVWINRLKQKQKHLVSQPLKLA